MRRLRLKAWLRLMKQKWIFTRTPEFNFYTSDDDEITDFDHRPFVAWINEEKGSLT